MDLKYVLNWQTVRIPDRILSQIRLKIKRILILKRKLRQHFTEHVSGQRQHTCNNVYTKSRCNVNNTNNCQKQQLNSVK